MCMIERKREELDLQETDMGVRRMYVLRGEMFVWQVCVEEREEREEEREIFSAGKKHVWETYVCEEEPCAYLKRVHYVHLRKQICL